MSALFIVVAAILLLGPLIAIHEFGHYFVARKLGVKVLVYSIGFGPTILKWTSKKSGIQYQLSALPLGGYVKMLDEREESVAEEDLPYAFNRQHPWKRIAIVAAGPLINLIFAILLFWLLFLPSQEQLNTRVGKVLADTPAAAAQMQVGDKITAIDGTPVTTWEKLNFALVDRVGETGKIQVQAERAGEIKTFSLPIQNFLNDQSQSPLDVLGFTPYRPQIPAIVSKLSEDGAAIRQGLASLETPPSRTPFPRDADKTTPDDGACHSPPHPASVATALPRRHPRRAAPRRGAASSPASPPPAS